MNQIIRQLAKTTSAIDAIRQDLIRCGFELEFHEMDGQSRGSLEDDEYFSTNAPHVEIGDDSSVEGGEIRTIGGLKPTEFMAAISAVFGEHTFKIDTGCSFHIHLSIPGINHQYGRAMQAELMAFLLANQHRLPESVRKRMNSDARSYFRFDNSPDKYRAANYHSQKTWEFRLFGNIKNTHDAWRCLLLAIDAMRHAYQVRCKAVESLVTIDTAANMYALSADAVKGQRSLKQQLRYDRLFKKTAQSA